MRRFLMSCTVLALLLALTGKSHAIDWSKITKPLPPTGAIRGTIAVPAVRAKGKPVNEGTCEITLYTVTYHRVSGAPPIPRLRQVKQIDVPVKDGKAFYLFDKAPVEVQLMVKAKFILFTYQADMDVDRTDYPLVPAGWLGSFEVKMGQLLERDFKGN